MAKTTMRMKNKMLTKIHLDQSGNLAMTGTKATSDAASKGLSAQPANPLTEAENTGNPGLPPSQMASDKLAEGSTGAPAERVAPDTMPEKDTQPAPKDLGTNASQLSPEEKALEASQPEAPEAQAPAPAAPEKAPHELVPSATSDKVLK